MKVIVYSGHQEKGVGEVYTWSKNWLDLKTQIWNFCWIEKPYSFQVS